MLYLSIQPTTKMPLAKCTMTNSYQVMMWTFGPINPDDKDAMRQTLFNMFRDAYQNYHLNPNSFRVAFEQGEDTGGDPYHHAHVVFRLATPARVSKTLLKDVKGLCTVDNEGRQPNAGVHYVPRNAQGNPLTILTNYLVSPHKSKTVDPTCPEFTPIRPPKFRPNPNSRMSEADQIELDHLLKELEKIVRRK